MTPENINKLIDLAKYSLTGLGWLIGIGLLLTFTIVAVRDANKP
jgi:hypothetical protein